jgi:hypothetical protein
VTALRISFLSSPFVSAPTSMRARNSSPSRSAKPAMRRAACACGDRRAHPRQNQGFATEGMFMGGNVPLGYVVKDRKLVVVDADAAIVRSIFERSKA